MNFLQSYLNKVSKYTIRLRKSIKNNDNDKVKEYYDHLKYHIQLGGFDQTELENKFESVQTLIDNLSNNLSNKGYKSFNSLYTELSKCNKDKTDAETLNKDLNKQITELNQKLLLSTESIEKIDSVNDNKKDIKITELNKDIEDLNKNIAELKLESAKIKSKNEINDNKLKNFDTIILEINKNEETASDNLELQTKEIVNKISRYNEIINKIKNQISDIDNADKEKFDKALGALVSKLEESEKQLKELKIATTTIEDLKKKLVNIDNISTKLKEAESKIDELAKSIEEKDKKIEELTTQITELEKEKESNDKSINDFTANFDEKIKELLKTIYGSENLVNSIIDGTVFNENIIEKKTIE